MKCVFIKKTNGKGFGIFALRDFRKGEIILRMDRSDRITKNNESKMSRDGWNHVNTCGYNKYFRLKPPERFINHSCDPNSYDKNGILYAISKIKKGREITYDYSINSFENWKMLCKCGSKKCRKIVTGKFSNLPAKLQIKYRPYLEDWFIEKEKRSTRR